MVDDREIEERERSLEDEGMLLMLPGPTTVPERVLKAMAQPMIGHRSKAFQALFDEVQQLLQKVFQTTSPVIVFPSAGTGTLESAIVNVFSPGDRVALLEIGEFGHRFGLIASAFGLQVEALHAEWGQYPDLDELSRLLASDTDGTIEGVLVTHNETSTGVTVDLHEVRNAMGDHDALLVADCVSSLGGIPVPTDEARVDLCLTGSQKALMTPPGLGLVAVSPKAQGRLSLSTSPRYYWDYASYLKYAERSMTPYTPAVSLWFALHEALRMIDEEGLDRVFRRHRKLGEAVRAGVAALGLSLLADEGHCSNTVTAVIAPPQVDVAGLRSVLEEQYSVMVGAGQGRVRDTVFRIGHMGATRPADVERTLVALAGALHEFGYQCSSDAAVRAARRAVEEVSD